MNTSSWKQIAGNDIMTFPDQKYDNFKESGWGKLANW
jgi:hypothetical protein